jgi:mono/diheme cytochrome c family protein
MKVKAFISILAIYFLAIIWNGPLRSAAQEAAKKLPEETRLIQSLDGSALYQAYCATCHGKNAKGNGPTAAALKTNPPDLTRLSTRNGGFPTAQVEKIISGNGAGIAAHGSREMPV